MREVGALLARILTNPDDGIAREETELAVAALTARFPVPGITE